MDCHAPFVFFGYELHLPPEMNARSSISLLYDLNGMIQKPFEIRSILPYFPPFVDDTVVTDGMICIVIGFTPTTARETYHHSKELAAYIVGNPVLDGFHLAEHAMFHCGIEWQPEVDSDDSSDASSEASGDASSDASSDARSEASHDGGSDASDEASRETSNEEYSDDYEEDAMEESNPPLPSPSDKLP
jgi:hypothetical protein